jgi:hypothetical protein
MRAGWFAALAGFLAVISLGSLAAAQDQPPAPPPPPAQTAAPLTPGQLDQLTAPIALYPDRLVGQILMAATYPLEIVEADRWLQQPDNAALRGDQLEAALTQQRWKPSVKSLAAFPEILRMMDNNLAWTERLGDAFLAGQAAIMDSVQRLRQRAEDAGKLETTPQQAVSNDDGAIVIEPPEPNIVYVPLYDPKIAYGTWPYPDYPPDYFPDFSADATIGALGFGWLGVGILTPLWGWAHPDWRHHRIDVDANRLNALNSHQPQIASLPGAGGFSAAPPAPLARPIVNAAPAATVITGRPDAPQIGRAPAAAAAAATIVLRPAFPVSQSFVRGPAVQAQAQRAQASRMPAPAFAPRVAARAPASQGRWVHR